jgi:hypothetical protein
MSARRSAAWAAVVALLGAAFAACATAEVTTPVVDPAATRPPPSSATPSPGQSAQPVPPARRASLVAQAPRTATLPSGRTVPIRAVGTTRTGLLDVPADIEVAGWWRGGSRLGDPFGSILVAAHVDSRTQGLGPFAELLTVDRGARIRLDSDDLRQTFVVRSRRLVPQGSLVDDSWIFAVSGDGRLTLVTCAPPYDAARGGYQNLAVVTALPVGPPEEP